MFEISCIILSDCGCCLSILCMVLVSNLPLLQCCTAAIVFLPPSASMRYSLTSYLQFCPVKLNANRVVIGTLRGFDQFMNLVVDNTVEVNGNDKNDIGMVVSNCLPFLPLSHIYSPHKPFGLKILFVDLFGCYDIFLTTNIFCRLSGGTVLS